MSIERHITKLRARNDLSGGEEQVIRSLVSEIREHPADATIVHEEADLRGA